MQSFEIETVANDDEDSLMGYQHNDRLHDDEHAPMLATPPSSGVHAMGTEGDEIMGTVGTTSRTKIIAGVSVAALGIWCMGVAYGMTSRLPDDAPTQPLLHNVDLEGKHHKIERKCDDGDYSKHTLQLAYELPFAALFRDTKGQTKFEASSVVMVGDAAFAVCDSSWAISKINDKLQPFGTDNVQIGNPQRVADEDSGYEALFHDDGKFYVVRESIQQLDQTFHAVIEQLAIGTDYLDYEVKTACPAEYEFEGNSKGYEGAIAVHDLNNTLVVLGLCEGNYCSEKKKDHRGHGRLVAMRQRLLSNGDCQWATVREIHIPSTAPFQDYSAITMDDTTGRVAISSQEDSQLWVGQMLGRQPDGKWDVDRMEFAANVSRVYDFPKNDHCDTVYCNIEGVHWINHDMIIAVSDKMKSHGRQDFRCFDKDQSVHVFVLP